MDREPELSELSEPSEPSERDLAALLAQAEAAHGEYETRELGGVFDQDWPRWYAAYLLDQGAGRLLPGEITAEQLADRLAACDEAYRREQPEAEWPHYYARHLLAPSPP